MDIQYMIVQKNLSKSQDQ